MIGVLLIVLSPVVAAQQSGGEAEQADQHLEAYRALREPLLREVLQAKRALERALTDGDSAEVFAARRALEAAQRDYDVVLSTIEYLKRVKNNPDTGFDDPRAVKQEINALKNRRNSLHREVRQARKEFRAAVATGDQELIFAAFDRLEAGKAELAEAETALEQNREVRYLIANDSPRIVDLARQSSDQEDSADTGTEDSSGSEDETGGEEPPPPPDPDPEPAPPPPPPQEEPKTAPPPVYGNARLTWTVPVTRANGDPLPVGELGGYEIYMTAENSGASEVIVINDPLQQEFLLRDLEADTYHFGISSFDTDGNVSDMSPIVSKTIQ